MVLHFSCFFHGRHRSFSFSNSHQPPGRLWQYPVVDQHQGRGQSQRQLQARPGPEVIPEPGQHQMPDVEGQLVQRRHGLSVLLAHELHGEDVAYHHGASSGCSEDEAQDCEGPVFWCHGCANSRQKLEDYSTDEGTSSAESEIIESKSYVNVLGLHEKRTR